MKKIYILFSTVLVTVASQAQIVINEVYGGGGNSGSVYKNDFVELINSGTSSATLSGATLQYASATGTFNAYHPLPDITLAPGQKYLIQEAAGAGGTTDLPSPDYVAPIPTPFTGTIGTTAGFSMAGSNGKIALVSDNLQIVTPTDANVLDFVGYGSATAFEGAKAAPAASAVNSVSRTNGIDTNDNGADFTAAAASPQNSLGVKQNAISGLNVYPNPVVNGNLFITSSNTAATKSVAIFDVLGKQVIKTNVSNQVVNVSKLISGVYILKITEEGKTATRKLVIK
ncbi:T9SS type A sorting domain-containing protein [Flavobacterium luteum]|uniref:T9SS type A sorting domain-containing protein n=1 Tax=Flavobacterium luteum TaxID=2026654 RepID=A0A7J5AHE7_9FLAO|nr:T9SS type A sorting domain-containing protein [Flavobacterium luteum]KAB1156818.1 T9SS type A sorting domain-containing protein [Flavobacterium luteum]